MKAIKSLVVIVFIAIASAASNASATIIFHDDFDGENGGVGTLNYYGWNNFIVSNGSVDLIGNGFFDFYPGNGLYVDLDGTTLDAGVFSTTGMNLGAGVYELSFVLGGSARGDTNSVTVSFGSYFNQVFSLASSSPLTTYTFLVNLLAPDFVALSFSNAGGDNIGAILAEVTISAVPEPASMSLLLLGGSSLLAARRRKSRV